MPKWSRKTLECYFRKRVGTPSEIEMLLYCHVSSKTLRWHIWRPRSDNEGTIFIFLGTKMNKFSKDYNGTSTGSTVWTRLASVIQLCTEPRTEAIRKLVLGRTSATRYIVTVQHSVPSPLLGNNVLNYVHLQCVRVLEYGNDASETYSIYRMQCRETRELPYDPRDASKAYGRAEDIRRSPYRERERRRSRSPIRSEPSVGDSSRPKDRERRRSRSADRHSKSRHRSRSAERHSHSHSHHRRSAEREQHGSRSTDKHSKHERRRSRSAERERDRGRNGRRSRSHERSRHRSRSKEGHKHKSREHPSHEDDYQRELHKELQRVKKSKSVEYQNGN